MRKLLALSLVLIFSTGCMQTWIEKRRESFEDCVIKMRKNEIGPQSGLEICKSIHGNTAAVDYARK